MRKRSVTTLPNHGIANLPTAQMARSTSSEGAGSEHSLHGQAKPEFKAEDLKLCAKRGGAGFRACRSTAFQSGLHVSNFQRPYPELPPQFYGVVLRRLAL